MENSLIFLYIGFSLSILLHCLTILVTLTLVIPVQTKEARITDRLVRLRKQLLMKGILTLIVAVVSVLALTSRFIFGGGDFYRWIIVLLIFIHAVGIFGKAYLDFKIYHQEYPKLKKRKH